MANPKLTPEKMQEALDTLNLHGTITAAAEAIGIPRNTLDSRLKAAKHHDVPTPLAVQHSIGHCFMQSLRRKVGRRQVSA